MKSNILMYVMICFLLVSCGDTDHAYQQLLSRISEYYESEKKNDWATAYSIRTPLFRKAVNKKYYMETMTRENSGWEFLTFNVLSLEVNKNMAEGLISFVEKPPKEFTRTMGISFAKTITHKEKVKWIRQDGIWYCASAGDRGRLNLNEELAQQKRQ